jgi:hypothetical protein
MQRTSEAIGTLATALAKAQCELINPEKTLEATIQSDRPDEAERTFRYASLSSGLEIVRKTLGRHEIAIAQTTSIDQATGIVNLTTVLAHSSGEWIASDWPVCPIGDTATPHRMGKALTYARRYALFTLVGIAGEDDLDAPDLATTANQKTTPQRPPGDTNGQLNGGRRTGGAKSFRSGSPGPILSPAASAELRDWLVAGLTNLGSGDEAALWAHRRLPEKNKLTAGDAQRVEEAFEARLTAFAATVAEPATKANFVQKQSKRKSRSKRVDKGTLALPESRRIRDRQHVRFVAKHPCLICGRTPADAHHLRHTQRPALGRKVSDEFTVPLCRGHHREVHSTGDETAWWAKAGIDPTITARSLWLETRPLLNEQSNPNGIAERVHSGAKSHRRTGEDSIPAAAPNYKAKPIAAGPP